VGKAKHNYLREINSLKTLKTQGLTSLLESMLRGSEEARELIILSQLSLVVQITKEYTNKGLDEEDLIAEGNCGLLQAVDSYQCTLGDFEAYASECIKTAIQSALQLQAEREKEHQALASKINAIIEAVEALTKKLDRIPKETEVAEYLKISLEELRYFMKLVGLSQAKDKEREED
jgi:RNA polymerase primary sigma factor